MKLIFDITREDYYEFNKFHFYKTRLRRTVITGIFTVVILELFLNLREFSLKATIFSFISFILVYIYSIYRSLKKTKNIPDEYGSILGQKEMEFTEDKILNKTINSEGSDAWASIKNFKEGAKAFYLYTDSNMAILIPKRVFVNAAEENEFRDLVNRKISAR